MNALKELSINARCRAFTLVEVLITMVTTVAILGGALAVYLYGLKMVQIVQPKMSASDDARRTVSLLTDDIRSAVDVRIGTRSNSTFTQVAPFTTQIGNALRIYPTTNTNQFVYYFWDTNDKTVRRTTNDATTTTLIASSVTNEMVFTGEDFLGNVMTNDSNTRVISTTLLFYQIQYPKVPVATNQYYDWYQLRCKATKRTIF